MNHIAPIPARITGWDRAAIVALGGAGCALSYDALQQMATAIHIRGFLTFVFPLVIDGFIAYGVRALLVLRTAPLTARCYVWMLFGTATAASIWANALHAVRLNQQRPQGAGLRLSDVTVGILSTLAPLALAGAVHLYILIARRVTGPALPGHPDNYGVRADRITADRRDTPVQQDENRSDLVSTGDPVAVSPPSVPATGLPAGTARSDTEEPADREGLSGQQEAPGESESEHTGRTADLGEEPVTRPIPVGRLHLTKPTVTEPGTVRDTGRPKRRSSGQRKPAPATDEQLLLIARRAVTEADDLSRMIVGDAIRRAGHGLGNDRLTVLMQRLRKEAEEEPVTQTR
ncbi:DUF2637 domain-containing protein [Streptomyces sp. 7N604]|uniref:DUF2637 domain-containing protein n=1 Tax=Streptomyces sp. 7N604 TaxID=3457415 RepID=UPI003FD126A2